MGTVQAQSLSIPVNQSEVVSGLLVVPDGARAALVVAHGAGAGMTHPFMEAVAVGFSDRGIATLRYQFPYMEKGGRRPDPPSVAQATVRAAVAEARVRLHSLPLFAGGKSFGGRMTSQAEAITPLQGVRGLVFLGFPLHPAGKPTVSRADHLFSVRLPMLFVQGTRDALADAVLLRQVTKRLGERASLAMIPDADHSFHVLARSGRTDDQVRSEMLDTSAAWMTGMRAQPSADT